MAKALRVPIKGLGDIGYLPDQDSYELAPNAISELQNFRMLNGWAEKTRGYRQVFDATITPPYFMCALATAATKYIVHATSSAVYVDDGSTRSPITPAAGLTAVVSNAWTHAVLSGILLLNNGTNRPMYWAGAVATPLQVLPGWTATYKARALRALRYHAVAIHITDSAASMPYLRRVLWSAAAEPGTVPQSWAVADPTNDAGQVDLAGDGALVDALPLGDSLVIYGEYDMHLMTYTGDPLNVFAFQKINDPIGMLAPGCGVVIPSIGHVVLTKDDVCVHNGQGAQSILDGKARTWLQNNLDPDYSDEAFVVANHQKSEVWICFPERNYSVCTKALVWNWQTQTLGKADLPNVTCGTAATFNWSVESFDSDSVTFDSESVLTFNNTADVFGQNSRRLLLGTAGNKIHVMDSSDLADGASFTGYIERTGIHLDAEDQRKHLMRLWPQIDAANGAQISVSFGASNDPETAPTYETAVTYTVGTDQWVDAWTEGRYLAYKLSSTSWFRMRSVVLEVKAGGKF